MKRLTKEEKVKLDIAQRASSVAIDELKPPPWMENDEIAVAEFNRVLENFEKIGLLDNLDLTILAGYCNAYSQYIKAVKMTKDAGDVIPKADQKGNINMVMNPAVKVADIYYKQMLVASQKMGLSSVDRLKLTDLENVKKSKNKFEDLLKARYGDDA